METYTKCHDTILHGLTPDSFLGDSSHRYFSSNFKRVVHHIDEIKIGHNNILANFSIQWPINWSNKKGISLQPHIGTLDFFLIAVRLAETYFRTVKMMHENQISEMWILEFHCKAGNKCIENSITSCKCQLISEVTEQNETEFILNISISDATIILKILLQAKGIRELSDISQQTFSEHEPYYSACYKEASRDITNIIVNTQEKYVTSKFELKHIDYSIYKGIGSIYMPCITFCDLILACGQLSQILLYQLDDTNRENASNLWLRNIHCVYRKPIKENTNILVKVNKSKIVNLRGSYYNCSDLVFDFNDGDLIAECSSAYQPFAK
jgi:hypothetical protein